jgi:hypothetical protein
MAATAVRIAAALTSFNFIMLISPEWIVRDKHSSAADVPDLPYAAITPV